AQRWGSSPCFIPGIKLSKIIFICTAWFPQAHCLWIKAVGLEHGPTFCFLSPLCPRCFGESFWLCYNRPVKKEKSRRLPTRPKPHAKTTGWSTPKRRSVLHRASLSTSAAIPPRGAVQRPHPFGPKRSGLLELSRSQRGG